MTPVFLLARCCDAAGKSDLYHNIVPKLLGEQFSAASAEHKVDGLPSYHWKLENKYYTADVQIVMATEPTLGNAEFASATQAVGLYFCSDRIACLRYSQSWLAYIKEFNADIRFLITDRITEMSANTKDDVWSWCIANNFELIELEPLDESDGDSEDDFTESTGVDRIQQAINAHTWTNLILKEQSSEPAYMKQLKDDLRSNSNDTQGVANGATTSSATLAASTSSDCGKSLSDQSREQIIDSQLLDCVFDHENDMENRTVDDLFSAVFKAKADIERLPVYSSERRELAASTISSIWKELGFPESELEGLDDSESD